MAKLTIVSGVGGKLPAAFLLEVRGRRILLDLGEGPEPGVRPDISEIGTVDAICVSHAHIDHAGALDLALEIGDPPIYATAATWQQIDMGLVAENRRNLLPVSGATKIAGVPVTLGRSGHAPGGVWFHFADDGGFLYTGDWSAESLLLPFDAPPPATCLVTDASYGDRNTNLASQFEAIVAFAGKGAVMCVPSGGRGPEMALALSNLGLDPAICPVVRSEMESLVGDTQRIIIDEKRDAIAQFLRSNPQPTVWRADQPIVTVEANAETGLAAELLQRIDEGFRFLFSGYVPDKTPAAVLLATGKAQWLPWNVHPRLIDTLDLCAQTNASYVIPAFVNPNDMPLLRQQLGSRLSETKTIEFHTTDWQSAPRAQAGAMR